MNFLESLVVLLLMAIVLLQISRRTSIPYPTMLAGAGVIVALIPGTPSIALEGHVALALFLAPVLADAAFDFPLPAIRRLWRPLLALAIIAVALTTAVVAWIGWAFAGLPVAAAIALGAIVAPPDAAAATSILRTARLPRRTVEVLTGESLLNDASALLLFTAAVAIQNHGAIDGGVALQLGLAVPGGIAVGLAGGWLFHHFVPATRGTLGGNLLEFVTAYLMWIVAERLHFSAVLAVVTMAMFMATVPEVRAGARHRVQSFAVWSAAVFLLNVLAFLLMGMQAREIVGGMSATRLGEAMRFAAVIVAAVIVTRLAWVLAYNRLSARFAVLRGDIRAPSLRQGVLVGWCGMRGLVSLATAFALPADFPQRDLIVLSAFAVVLATLVFQGLTLPALIRLLKLHDNGGRERELATAQQALAETALAAIDGTKGRAATETRRWLALEHAALNDEEKAGDFAERRRLKLTAIAAQRERLQAMRDDETIGDEVFAALQEELDWRELATLPEGRRTMEEG